MTSRLSADHGSLRFFVLAALVLILGATGVAFLTPFAARAARDRSASFTREAFVAHGAEAEADYALATWLDRGNTKAFAGLARAQVVAGRPNDALNALVSAGQGAEPSRLKV